MSAAQFTAAPWQAVYMLQENEDGSEETERNWVIVNPDLGPNDDFVIADMHGPDAEANACLIAAAPALYEALEQLLDDMGEDGLCVCPAAKEQAQKALKAASPDDRGEEAARTSADKAQ